MAVHAHGSPRETPNTASSGTAFGEVLSRNIRTLVDLRQQAQRRQGIQDRIADAITRFTGSMVFVYIHLIWIGSWVVVNLGWVGIRPFDPYPFGLLTMIGSLEAIFLSTFVLISQNRMAAAADRRAELDLQISLLSEHEVTQAIKMLDAIVQHLGVPIMPSSDVEEAKHDVDPAIVLEAIDAHEARPAGQGG
jgi:uncharacterized membrane protein